MSVSNIVTSTSDILAGLENIRRGQITPNDIVIYQQDPIMQQLSKIIENSLDQMTRYTEMMTEGDFTWHEEIPKGSWKDIINQTCTSYNMLPEKQMVDLVEIKGFRELIDPFSMRIFLESTQEIFENQERMKNLEVISSSFEVFMRLQFMADVNYLPRIDSRHIQLMDPFMRCKIREMNRTNEDLIEKYLGVNFNVKKFCLEFLER